MNTQDFVKKLNDAQDLMSKEKYKEAIIILEKLKEIEKKQDFNYSLAHRLYQLISNSHSLFNQQIILNRINELFKTIKVIEIQKLNQILKNKDNLLIDDTILERDLEILIMRNVLSCKISGNNLIIN